MKFLLLSGSFHSKSRSLAILKNIEIYFDGHELDTPLLDRLPFYSEDLNVNKPEQVDAFLSKVASADGLLICTPEYNHSIPAVLKNAIDWASRPAFNSPLKGLPVSLITQAVSAVGGARVQAHLKLVLDSTLSEIHLCHEMMISGVDKIFNHDMNISNSSVSTRLERHVEAFIQFSKNKAN